VAEKEGEEVMAKVAKEGVLQERRGRQCRSGFWISLNSFDAATINPAYHERDGGGV